MMRSSRGNRLSSVWRCLHCKTEIDTRTFRLHPRDPRQLVCPNTDCGKSFAWKSQNKGRLWPEQRAYNVLR